MKLDAVEPCLAGPKRPQDRVLLKNAKSAFADGAADDAGAARRARRTAAAAAVTPTAAVAVADVEPGVLDHGSVVIAAITSCTNTSNPSVMIGAGLLAKKAVELGLTRKPWVKSSLAPGSKVVTEYLDYAGLSPFLDQLGFNLVGYGCTTCIGNSGPLPDDISREIKEENLVVASVLSGNRNFEGRIQQEVRANYLASPPLVVAYALAGTITKDLTTEPLGTTPDGKDIYLKDIWPTEQEIQTTMVKAVTAGMFRRSYAKVYDGDERWQGLQVPEGSRFEWEPDSTYIRKPTFLEGMTMTPPAGKQILGGARAGAARRQRHHRSHLARRVDQGRHAGRTVPDGEGREGVGLQLLRRAPRQPRGHGARHLRQRAAAQPDGARAPRAASPPTSRLAR